MIDSFTFKLKTRVGDPVVVRDGEDFTIHCPMSFELDGKPTGPPSLVEVYSSYKERLL